MDKIYLDRNGAAHRFIGVMLAPDDYYYCMLSMTGKLEMLSCVGNIEGHGYTPVIVSQKPTNDPHNAKG